MRNSKNKKEKKTYLFENAIVYGEYKVSIIEKLIVFIVGFLAGYVVGYVFYGIVIISIFTGIVFAIYLQPQYRQMRIDRQKKAINLQFKSLLETLAFSINAGMTIDKAFVEAEKDLMIQYNKKDYIIREIQTFNSGHVSNLQYHEMLYDLAIRSESDDIYSFASVYDTCKDTDEIGKIILNTYNVLNDKMNIKMEIETIVASSKMELNIMTVMPVFFVFVLNSMGSEITGRGTALGYLTTTIALILFVVAHIVGKKVLNIKM